MSALPSRRALIAGLAAAWPTRGRAQSREFDLPAFFVGRTRGVGELLVINRSEPERFTVDGRCDRRDGLILLRQAITYDDGRVERRAWAMRPSGPDAWRVAGSDMVGLGWTARYGDAWRIGWRRRGGPFGVINVVQTLRPRPDGALDNLGEFQRYGVVLARLRERIERV